MAPWQRRLIGLGLPCLCAVLLDDALTLHGQPVEYWAGEYARTSEAAPFYRLLYAWHPAAVAGGYLLWIGLLGGLLVLLPEVLAVVLAIAVVLGHTWGASTWVVGMILRKYDPLAVLAAGGEYKATNALFVFAALIVGVGVHWTVRSGALYDRAELRRQLPGWLRWGLVFLLLGAVAAIVFAPW